MGFLPPLSRLAIAFAPSPALLTPHGYLPLSAR